jgi:hypothetical protein
VYSYVTKVPTLIVITSQELVAEGLHLFTTLKWSIVGHKYKHAGEVEVFVAQWQKTQGVVFLYRL